MTQPRIGDVIAAQQDTIDELTAAVARHEHTLARLVEHLAAHGIPVDLDQGREE